MPLSLLQGSTSIGPPGRKAEMDYGSLPFTQPPISPEGLIPGTLGPPSTGGLRGMGKQALQGLKGFFSSPTTAMESSAPAVRGLQHPGLMDDFLASQGPKPSFEMGGTNFKMNPAGSHVASPQVLQESLGEMDPMFTPMGGEGMYNVGRKSGPGVPNLTEQMYQNVLRKGGR